MPKCETTLVNLLHIFRTPFYKSISGGLLLEVAVTQWLRVQLLVMLGPRLTYFR